MEFGVMELEYEKEKGGEQGKIPNIYFLDIVVIN